MLVVSCAAAWGLAVLSLGTAKADPSAKIALQWGPDGYFSTMNQGAKPVMDNEDEDQNVATDDPWDNVGWKRTRAIMFGKSGSVENAAKGLETKYGSYTWSTSNGLADASTITSNPNICPTDEYTGFFTYGGSAHGYTVKCPIEVTTPMQNISIRGKYKAIGVGEISSTPQTIAAAGMALPQYLNIGQSSNTSVEDNEVLLFADDLTTGAFSAFSWTDEVAYYDNGADALKSQIAVVTDNAATIQYSEFEQELLSSRAIEGVCRKKPFCYSMSGEPNGTGDAGNVSAYPYKVFPISFGDAKLFFGTQTDYIYLSSHMSNASDTAADLVAAGLAGYQYSGRVDENNVLTGYPRNANLMCATRSESGSARCNGDMTTTLVQGSSSGQWWMRSQAWNAHQRPNNGTTSYGYCNPKHAIQTEAGMFREPCPYDYDADRDPNRLRQRYRIDPPLSFVRTNGLAIYAGGADHMKNSLRQATRLKLDNLLLTARTDNQAQVDGVVDDYSNITDRDMTYSLTFVKDGEELTNPGAEITNNTLSLSGTHNLGGNVLGWKLVDPDDDSGEVLASGRTGTGGNMTLPTMTAGKEYELTYWGQKNGDSSGWTNIATDPTKVRVVNNEILEDEPGVDLDKFAPVVSCPSDVSVVGYDRCAVWWDVVVSNTGGVALGGVVLSDRVSSVVDDVVVEVKEGGSGLLSASSTSPVVGGFVTRAYELPDVAVSGSVRVRVSGSVERALVDVVVVNQAWVTADGVPRDVPAAPSVPSVAQVAAGSWDTGVPSANRWDAEPLDGVPGNAGCTSDADVSGGVGDACDQVPAVIVHREVPVVPEVPGLDVDKGAPEVSCPGSGDEGHGSCVVSWDVRVSNTGGTALNAVSLSDRLPAGVSGVGVSETPSFTAVSAGGAGGVGVDARGRVWAWGDPVFSGGPDASGTGPWLVAEQAPVMQGVVFTRVSAGDRHVVALDEDGRVWSWGANDAYQSGDGTKTENAGQMEPRIMGVDYAVAKMSGVVFTGVDAGATHTVALDGDGRAWVWGNNAQRQSGDNSNGVTSAKVSPRVIGVDITGQYNDDDDPALSGVVFTAVSAGGDQTVALDDDGGVWRWGSFAGEADGGEGARKPALVSSYMSVMQGVVFTSVSAGGTHAVALDEQGRVWSWGNNEAGQSGDGTDDHDEANYQARVMGGSGYATAMAGEVYGSVSAGGWYSQALDASGRLWSWGDGVGGVLADGVSDGSNVLSVPFTVSGVGGVNRDAFERSVPVGSSSSLSGWTTRTYELGALPVAGSSVLVHVSGTVARGETDVVVVNQAWATADEVDRTAPTAPVVPSAEDVTANGWDEEPDDGVPGNGSCTSDADGSGVGDACDQVPAVVPLLVVPKLPGLDVDKSAPEVSCPAQGDAGFGSCVVSWDVRVSNTGGTALHGVSLSDRLPAGVTGVGVSETPSFTAVSAGGAGGVGVDARGRVWAWGDPVFSGDPDASGEGPWLVAEQAPVMQGVVFTQVSAGDRHVVALDAQGRVWSWGANGSYQSGDGSKTGSDAQVKPRVMGDYAAAMSGVTFVSVDAGATHSAAVDGDGRVWVWGNNAGYRSGDGVNGVNAANTVPRIIGVDILQGDAANDPPLSGVVFTRVSVGGTQTVALDASGRVWRWGAAGAGQNGDETGAKYRKPVMMASYRDVMQGVVFTDVSAGGTHAVALDATGRVWSWGGNEAGQSGDGTQDEEDENLAVRVMGEDGYATSMSGVVFTSVSAGGAHSLALDVSGRVWSWGSNEVGQSGDGTVTDGAGTWVPRVMGVNYAASMTGAVFASLSAGGVHAHALDVTGRLWSWGDDQGVDSSGGVLADGQTLLTPRAVSGVGGSNRDAFARSVPPDGVPVSEGLWATRTYALGAIPVPGSTILLRVTATADRVEGVDQVVVNQAWATADEKTRLAPTAPTVPLAAQVTAQGWDKEPGDGVPGNLSCVTDADGGLGGADACDQVPGIVTMLDAPLDPNAPVTGLPYTGAFPWWLLILIAGITLSGAGIAGMGHQTRLGTQNPNAGHSSFPGIPHAWMRRTLRALPCRHARVR
jgi:uncharacterized repeat protein (TIGR01451 family)